MLLGLRIKTSKVYLFLRRGFVKIEKKLTDRYNTLGDKGQIIVLSLVGLLSIVGIYAVSVLCREVAINTFQMLMHNIKEYVLELIVEWRSIL